MDFNYSELLAFDRASSVTLTKSKAARKLAAWANRLTSTDYPATWEVDLLNGAVETLSLATAYTVSGCTDSAFNGRYVYRTAESKFRMDSTHTMWRVAGVSWYMSDGVITYTAADNGLNTPPVAFTKTGGTATVAVSTSVKAWESASLVLQIGFTNAVATSYVLTYGTYQYSGSLVVEGFLTLTYGALTTRLNICDPEVRHGDDETKIEFNDIQRAAITDELDEYISSRLNRLENETIKGYGLDGVWRLTGTYKVDSDSPDKTNVILLYKRGYAQTLDFSEALLMSKEDWNTDAYNLTIKFPNIDPRYAESAKASVISALTDRVIANPVFGGVVYAGYWNSIRMITSETSSQAGATGNPEDSSNVIWFLTQHNNTDLYFNVQTAPDTIKGYFYKWEATETTLATLIEDTQFDMDGNIVTSGGKTLQEVIAGRVVQIRRTTRDPEDRLFDVEIEITWSEKFTLRDANETLAFHQDASRDVVIDQGFNIPDSLLSGYAAHYANLADNQQAVFRPERDKDNGTFSYTATITTRSCRNGYSETAGAWILYGSGAISTSQIAVPTAIDASGFVTWAQLKTQLSDFEVQASVRPDDDGTFSFNMQVVRPHSSTKTFGNSESFTLTASEAGTVFESVLSFTGICPSWITAGVKILIESSSTDADVSKILGIFSCNGALQQPEGFFQIGIIGVKPITFSGKSVVCTLTVDPEKASGITQKWVESAKSASTLPTDTTSSYDEVNGSWYEEVDFRYEIAGVDLYNWTKQTTRHQVLQRGYQPFSITNKPVKKHEVKTVSFQPMGRKTRGNWKREVVPWSDAWNGYVGGSSTPPTWLSLGYQAKYGDWQSWFVKASNSSSGSIVVGGVIVSTYSSEANYISNESVSSGGNIWRKKRSGQNLHNHPPTTITSDDFWEYRYYGSSDLNPVWSDSINYTYNQFIKVLVGDTYLIFSSKNIAVHDQTPSNASLYWEWVQASPVTGSTTGDDYGSYIGRSGTGSIRYSADHFGQKAIHAYFKTNEAGALGVPSYSSQTNLYGIGSFDRNLTSAYQAPANLQGYSFYDHEVVKLKTYRELQEYIPWNTLFEFSSSTPYAAGSVIYYPSTRLRYKAKASPNTPTSGTVPTDEDHWEVTTDNPTAWDSTYSSRFGNWKVEWVKASLVSGDNCGDYIGIYGSSSPTYKPPPNTDGLYFNYISNQSGALGVPSYSSQTNLYGIGSFDRNLSFSVSSAIYGWSVYSVALAFATVLNESGDPELEDGASVNYAPMPYEHPYFCQIGTRTRQWITSITERRYFVVNPAIISNNPIPVSRSALCSPDTSQQPVSPYDSNAETKHDTGRLGEFLWFVERTVIFYGEPEADTPEESSNPAELGKIRNFPVVDSNGYYMFYHSPVAVNSILGTSPTTGKYPRVKFLD